MMIKNNQYGTQVIETWDIKSNSNHVADYGDKKKKTLLNHQLGTWLRLGMLELPQWIVNQGIFNIENGSLNSRYSMEV